MNLKLADPDNLRTEVPIELHILNVDSRPTVSASKLGIIPVHKNGKNYIAKFYSQEPGEFLINVSTKDVEKHITINIKQQQYLNFYAHFTPWVTATTIVLGVLLLWTKRNLKLKKKSF